MLEDNNKMGVQSRLLIISVFSQWVILHTSDGVTEPIPMPTSQPFDETTSATNIAQNLVSNSLNIYGNDVVKRQGPLLVGGDKSWIDTVTLLPSGVLHTYYVYIHNCSYVGDVSNTCTQDAAKVTTEIRLQIWRPFDIPNHQYALVYESIQVVDFTSTTGLFYAFDVVSDNFNTVVGDLIGWTNANIYGPVSLAYENDHRTIFRNIVNVLPTVSTTMAYTFDKIKFPAIFSVAVQIDTNGAVTELIPKPTSQPFDETTSAASIDQNSGPDDLCLDCICGVMSGDGTPGCGVTYSIRGEQICGVSDCIVRGRQCRCGSFLLTEPMFNECRLLTALQFHDFHQCSSSKNCARECIKAYLGQHTATCIGKQNDVLICGDYVSVLLNYRPNNPCPRQTRYSNYQEQVQECVMIWP